MSRIIQDNLRTKYAPNWKSLLKTTLLEVLLIEGDTIRLYDRLIPIDLA